MTHLSWSPSVPIHFELSIEVRTKDSHTPSYSQPNHLIFQLSTKESSPPDEISQTQSPNKRRLVTEYQSTSISVSLDSHELKHPHGLFLLSERKGPSRCGK
ncbi:hypothetical protein ONS95_013384 [Cadophora gregata]|uniref:uncharacterized protein n=1 Tax=Cadophora gregata TaxID=51156 RepID=UPI0026DAB582|nr:uncharacterized protein ONS95_013384 [Cadophora gregata]KAK0116364.1 hypothetical protein ONS95_013384 [Cadophora gregata]